MYTVKRSTSFNRWESELKDETAKALISSKVARLQFGHTGDHKSVGEGIWELRIHYGPGFRIYFCRRGNEIILLLHGGHKGSQHADIEKAKRIKKELAL